MYEYKMMLERESRHPYLIEEMSVPYHEMKNANTADVVVDMMNAVYGCSSMFEECLYMLAMNTKLDVTGVFRIGHGTVDSCLADTKAVFSRALLAGAKGVLLLHNHPSGDPTPSKHDIETTKKMAIAGALLGIEVIDHIIVGKDCHVSLRETHADTLKPVRPEVMYERLFERP